MRLLRLFIGAGLLATAAFFGHRAIVVADPPLPLRVVTTVQPTDQTAFRPGQRWAYQTRPGEDSSTVTILRVEEAPKLGVVVHVAVEDVRIASPADPAQHVTRIGHLPFTKAAIERSVTRKLRDDAPLPAFEDGYRQWRSAFDAGRAGAFTITIAEAVEAVEKMR